MSFSATCSNKYEDVNVFCKEKELDLFKEAFEVHKEDIKFSKINNCKLNGMCACLDSAYKGMYGCYTPSYHYLLRISPKFKQLIGDKDVQDWIWKRNNKSKVRYRHFVRIIKELKKEIAVEKKKKA